MKFGVLVFPGSNCDYDCFNVINDVFEEDVEFVWHKEKSVRGLDCIIIPGGFSYGDYLRTGAIARFSPVMTSVEEFAKEGGLMIGICNGFQILLEAGLLPGAMMKNESLKFICRYVFVKVERADTPFTNQFKKGDVLRIPIAHSDGNYYAGKEPLKLLKDNDQVVFRYCDSNGVIDEASNPNGSILNIAGVCSREGNILGLMPHPERCSEDILGGADGRKIFESVVKFREGL